MYSSVGIIPTLDIQCQVGPQQIITTTTTHGCGGHKAAAWREVLLKVKKKSARYEGAGPVRCPSPCAQEGSVRWRVQGLCYESRARVRNQQRGQLGEQYSVWSIGRFDFVNFWR